MSTGRNSIDQDRSRLNEELPSTRWLQDSLGHVRDLSDRVAELSTLMGVSAVISSELPLTEMLDQVCRLTAEICRSDAAFVHLCDGEEDLVCLARHAPSDSLQYAWEGVARLYGRRATSSGKLSSRSSLLLRAEGEETGQGRMGGICSVPLKGRAQVVGALAIGYAGAHRFSAREKDMLNAISAQVAMAVERSWLFDQLQEQLARANSLREVANRIASNLRLDLVLDSVADHASKLLAAEFSAIFLADQPGVPASDGEMPGGGHREPRKAELALDDSLLGRAVRRAVETGTAAISMSDPPRAHAESPQGPHAEEYRVALAVPLLSSDEVLGALALCYLERRHFDRTDIALAEDFAGQAVLAIQNARLYEDAMENRHSLEAAINQISNHGISVLDDDLNIQFANPATFWLLGVKPKKGAVPVAEWASLVKRGLLEKSEVDVLLEQMREQPGETIQVMLSAKGRTKGGRTIKLLSLPLRRQDGSVRGRVNLLEEE